MTVGTIRIRLVLREAHSLKDKRQILRSVKDRLRKRFNVSVAEIGSQDYWQSAELGIAAVGVDRAYVNGLLDKALGLVRAAPRAELVDFQMEFS